MSAAMKLADQLRQMLAVLDTERQALAALDIDALMMSTQDKHSLCSLLETQAADGLDDECRTLVEAARHRNLMAANVAARLDALTASPGTYLAPRAQSL